MKHLDGRVTTVPVHNDEDLPKGLLRKIILEDPIVIGLKMDIDEFVSHVN
jgi:HicA toxin of bacterial toxin-antitoxin,